MAHLDEHPSRHDVVDVVSTGDGAVVRCLVDLDGEAARSLAQCLGSLADGGVARVVLDLSAVAYCDAEGLGVLLGAHRHLDGALEVRGATRPVRRLIDERGLHHVLRLT